MSENKLPTIQELHRDKELGFKLDSLNFLLNQKPIERWVKEHPFAKGVKYVPIDKVEYLLTKIFGGYSVQVVDYKQLANSISVHVRLSVINPVDGNTIVQDGLGAVAIQVEKGESASNLAAIKSDAIMKALPAAKSYAIKDAAEQLGQLFGGNLNRKDIVSFEQHDKIADKWKI